MATSLKYRQIVPKISYGWLIELPPIEIDLLSQYIAVKGDSQIHHIVSLGSTLSGATTI